MSIYLAGTFVAFGIATVISNYDEHLKIKGVHKILFCLFCAAFSWLFVGGTIGDICNRMKGTK